MKMLLAILLFLLYGLGVIACSSKQTNYRVTTKGTIIQEDTAEIIAQYVGKNWVQTANTLADSPMRKRVLSYQIDSNTEIYVSLVKGSIASNQKRWRNTFIKLQQEEEGTARILGKPAHLLYLLGTTHQQKVITNLTALATLTDGMVLSIKLVGNKQAYQHYQAAFIKFCQSLTIIK